MNRPPIIVVEDSDEDFDVMQLLLVSIGVQNPLLRCKTSDEALAMFERFGQRGFLGAPEKLPQMMLLDLNLPGMDGRELLQRFRKHERLHPIPVIVLSTSANPRDVQFCYSAGANGYLVKPVDLDRLEQMLDALVNFWLRVAIVPADVDEPGSVVG